MASGTITDLWVFQLDSTGKPIKAWNVLTPGYGTNNGLPASPAPIIIPEWSQREYSAGTMRIDLRFKNTGTEAGTFRFDTQTVGLQTGRSGDRIQTGTAVIEPNAENVFNHHIRMWAENITEKNWVVETVSNQEVATKPFTVQVASVFNQIPWAYLVGGLAVFAVIAYALKKRKR